MAQAKVEISVVDKTARALRNINQRITGLNKGLLGVNRVAGLATGALAALGGAQILRRIVSVSAEFEDLRSTLRSVTGSAQEGAQAFDFITNLSTKTQFSVQDLSKTFIKLKTAGIEPTTQLFRTMTDAAAVTTDQIGVLTAITDVFTRTTQSGVVELMEFDKLADRGLPVYDILKEKLGVTRNELNKFSKETGNAKLVLDTLADAINERFGGATEARLNNLSVQFSNLNIAIDKASDTIGRGGLNAALNDLTTRITDAIEGNSELANEIGRNLAKAVIIFGDALSFTVRNLDTLALAAIAFLGLKLTLAVTSLAIAFSGALVKAIGFAIATFKLLNKALLLTKMRMATLLSFISLAVYGLSELATESEWVKKKLGLVDDGMDDLAEGAEGATTFTEKLTNGLKTMTGVDVPGYLKGIEDRTDALVEGQKELNKKTEEYNAAVNNPDLKKRQEEATKNLAERKKTFEDIIKDAERQNALSTIALEKNELIRAIKTAELDLGRQLTDEERKKLNLLLQSTKANEELLAFEAKKKNLASSMADVVAQGLTTELSLLKQAKTQAEQILKERLDQGIIDYGTYISGLNQLDDEYRLRKDQMDKTLSDRLTEYRINNIKKELAYGRKALAVKLSEADQEYLQKRGKEEKQEQIVRDRIEFEKKSELDKTKFGLEQAGVFFQGLSAYNKKFFAAYKAFAIAQAIINTYQGATKALATYPPPFNFIAAAATVASGLAQVATIRAQTAQRGGKVIGGQPVAVGEDGPELIVPKQSSTVIPREVADAIGDMGGKGNSPVIVNFNISTVDAEGFDELLIRRRATITGIINTALEKRGKVGVTG